MSAGNDPWAKFNEKFQQGPPAPVPPPAPPNLPPPPAAPPNLPPPPATPPPLPASRAPEAPSVIIRPSAAAVVAAAASAVPAPVENRWQKWLSIAGQVAEVVGSALSASGYKPMKPAPGARTYEPSRNVLGSGSLPPKVDLRPHLTAIEDQGPLSSCTANAVAASYEYWVKRWTSQDFDVSRLFIYYNARWRNNEQDKDAGSVIQLAMDGLQNFGACSEATWPYQKPLVLQKPNAPSYEEGARNLVQDSRQVPVELQAWKQCLAEGNPIIFGTLLFDSFDQASKRGGVVPMPSPTEVGRTAHGAHAMCAVGYSDAESVFIVRNSWGTGWGDQGYCYMPYNYLMSDKLNLGDCWIFTPSPDKTPPPSQDTWHTDDKPVTNGGEGVDFDINPFKTIDYSGVIADEGFKEIVLPWNDTTPETFERYSGLVEEAKFDALDNFKLEEIEGFDPENDGTIAWEDSLFANEEDAKSDKNSEDEAGDENDAAHAGQVDSPVEGGIGAAAHAETADDEGPLLDADGNAVDAAGNYVDENGNPVDANGNFVDEDGNPVDENGNPVDENGNLIDENGDVVDENGNRIDENGNLLDDQGNPVDANGNFVDENGNLIDENGNLVDENGNLIDENGNLVDQDGNPVDADGNPVEAEEGYVDADGNPVDADGNLLDENGELLASNEEADAEEPEGHEAESGGESDGDSDDDDPRRDDKN